MQGERPEQTDFFKNLFKAPATPESILVDQLLALIEKKEELNPTDLSEKVCEKIREFIQAHQQLHEFFLQNPCYQKLHSTIMHFDMGFKSPGMFIAEIKQILQE